MRGERCEPGGGRAWSAVAAHKTHAPGRPDSRLGGAKGTRGAHKEHGAHVCDAGGVPAGNVRVEAFEVAAGIIVIVNTVIVIVILEEGAHVGDGRDVPVGDGASCRSGGSRVSDELLDCSLQGGLGREDAG